jgi:zinc/manganese transport system ATP-binding protein
LGKITHADIAYLPQQAEIDRSLPLSVFDLVAMGLWHEIGVFQSLNAAQRERIMHALDQVGLVDFSGKSIAALSRGQFQRVLFARILVQNAQVIILDEPFNAIDSKTTEDLLALVQTWPAQGKTVLAVLHDFNQVRTGFSQTVLLANELIAWGATSQVLTPENLAIANQRAEHWTEQKELCSS